MQKFLAIAIFAVGIFAAQISTAQASDVYVGTYSSGYQVDLMTETVRLQSRDRMDYTCRVKAVRGGDVIYVDYTFWEDRQSPYEFYRDSSGNTGKFTFGSANGHPVPHAIDSYISEHFYN